jgi:hypothetical protein
VDVSALDSGHILPNIEPPNWRGIWFPRGFALPWGCLHSTETLPRRNVGRLMHHLIESEH